MRRLWNALNHAGMALFVFLVIVGVFLWSTGSLRLDPSAATDPSAHFEGDGHGHEAAGHEADDHAEEHEGAEATGHEGHDHPKDWCDEHGVPESACTKCDASLVPQFQAKGDWCAEHTLPESQCEQCNPGCRAKLAAARGVPQDNLAALAKRLCEHKKPILTCDDCRYQVGAVKVEPDVAKRLLKTGTVEQQHPVKMLRLTGEVQLDKTRVVEVTPTASGRIIDVKVFLGQSVKTNDTLTTVHSGDFGEAKAAYLTAYTECEITRREQERHAAVTDALDKLLKHMAKVKDHDRDKEHGTVLNHDLPKELVGEWKSKLLGAAAKLRLAEVNHSREKGLWEKGVSSKAEYDTARQEWESTQAEYMALVEAVHLNLSLEKLRADNAVRKAEAALHAAEQYLRIYGLTQDDLKNLHDRKGNGDFAHLVVKAPRAGTVIAQNASQGRFVETADSLYTIADLSHLWVWCDAYERDLAALHALLAEKKSVAAKVTVAAFPGTTFPGTIDLVGSTLDEHTRTVKVRVQVQNPKGMLKPGMFATVEVAIASRKKVALVPREAVLSDEDKRFVFEKWKGDLWVRRDVVVGDGSEQNVAILAGLRAGVTIATGGGFMLKSDVLRNKMGAG